MFWYFPKTILLTIKSLTVVFFLLGSSLVTAENSIYDVRALVSEYSKAWSSRDVEKIITLHSSQTEFRLFMSGEKPAVGKPAVKAAFEKILKSNPEYSSLVQDVKFGDGFVYVRYQMVMGRDSVSDISGVKYVPVAGEYVVDAVDYIEFSAGLVSKKHTFIDLKKILENSRVDS